MHSLVLRPTLEFLVCSTFVFFALFLFEFRSIWHFQLCYLVICVPSYFVLPIKAFSVANFDLILYGKFAHNLKKEFSLPLRDN